MSQTLKILTVPDDTAVLRKTSDPVTTIDAGLLAFLRDLGETLKIQRDPQGVGLSGIQVGRPIRVFATWLSEEGTRAEGQGLKDVKNGLRGTDNELIFYLNPEIIDHSPDMTLGEDLVESNKKLLSGPRSTVHDPQTLKPFLEGCLSIPEIYGPVLRWSWIRAKAAILTESQLLQYSVSSIQYSVFSLNGLSSRVFQHELDHLNGILFTDLTLRQGYQLYRQTEKEMAPMEM